MTTETPVQEGEASIVARYEEHLKGRKMRSAKIYVFAAERFMKWLSARKLGLPQVVPAIVNDYLLQRRSPEDKPATVVAVISRLRDFFRFTIAAQVLTENPAKDVSHWWLDIPGGLPACSPTIRRIFPSPYDALKFRCPLFAPHWENHLEHLAEQGYSRHHFHHVAEHVSRFHDWLKKSGARTMRQAPHSRLEEYLRFMQREFRRSRRRPMSAEYVAHVRRCINPLLTLGWEKIASGTIRPPRPKVQSAIPDALLTEFLDFCVSHRGLSQASVRTYHNELLQLRRFLIRQSLLDLAVLTPGDIDAYLIWRSEGRSPRALKAVATAVRAFFRFLHLSGRIQRDLAESVLSPHRYSADLRPKYLPWQRIEDILAKVDRTTDVGKRDYAILVLLACHGLRVREVARLRVEDVDLDGRRLHLHRKGGVLADLPIADRGAEALREYLAIRPARPYNQVFLRDQAPLKPLKNGGISAVAQRHLREVAGHGGGYALRHSFAKTLIDRGAGLHEVGILLGHQTVRSTLIYTRIATEELREVADNYATWL